MCMCVRMCVCVYTSDVHRALRYKLKHDQGWPEPYIYIYIVHDRMYGDFPAKNTVHTRL